MASVQQIIQKAVNKARIDWLHYTVKQEKQIYSLYQDAANKIQARLSKYAAEGKIPPNRLKVILGDMNNPHPDSIRGVLRELRPKVTGQIKGSMTQSVNYGMKTQIYGMQPVKGKFSGKIGIGTSFIGRDGIIRTYDVHKQLYKQSAWAKINSEAMDALIRTQYGGVTLSDRIWDNVWQAEKMMRNLISTGVLLVDSFEKIERDLRAYLIHPDTRFHRVMKDGKLVLSQPARRYKPGRGVYRSAYQNARRVARTEMARAYNEGTVRYGKTKKWIKGWISRVGSSNPAPYDAAVNGKFFPKDNPPNIPYHPQCVLGDSLVQAGGDIIRTSRRWYKGEMIIIYSASGKKLTCTPNHPIFSDGTFVSADALNIGSNLVCINSCNLPSFNRYNIQKPSLIKDICRTWEKSFTCFSIPVKISSKDFHGDGVGSNVAIITTNSFLRNRINIPIFEHFKKFLFFIRDYARSIRIGFNSLGALTFSLPRDFFTSIGFLSSLCHNNFLPFRIFAGTQEIGFFLPSNLNVIFNQPSSNSATINTKSLSELLFRNARFIQGNDFISRQIESIPNTPFGFNDKIAHIKSFQYDGYVYNLETTQSYYFANGIATHNCMCYAETVLEDTPDSELELAPTQAEFEKQTGVKVA